MRRRTDGPVTAEQVPPDPPRRGLFRWPHLVVHARDGRTETTATWSSGYATTETIPASTSISPQDISAMDVLNSSGLILTK